MLDHSRALKCSISSFEESHRNDLQLLVLSARGLDEDLQAGVMSSCDRFDVLSSLAVSAPSKHLHTVLLYVFVTVAYMLVRLLVVNLNQVHQRVCLVRDQSIAAGLCR